GKCVYGKPYREFESHPLRHPASLSELRRIVKALTTKQDALRSFSAEGLILLTWYVIVQTT
ncbi:hypothetical protein VZ95_20325, partial [Elstera litoralis]